MIQKTLALLHRALRVDARLVRTHAFRAGLVALVAYQLSEVAWGGGAWFGAPGLRFFAWVCLWNFWFITLAAATFFATAITEEKEEQTLGLLKMAGIGPLALLTGKWLPRMFGAALLLSVQFPFTVLAITLGGVLWDQVLAAYWALLAHLVLVGSVGLLASVVCRRSSEACGVTSAVLGAYLLLPWLMVSLLSGLFGTSGAPAFLPVVEACEWLQRTSALSRLSLVMATNFNEPPIGLQVMSNLLAGGVLFGVACAAFGPCTRNETAAVRLSWLDRLSRAGRRGSRRTCTWAHPLAWKDYHFIAGGVRLAVVRTCGYGLVVLICTLLIRMPLTGSIDLEDVGGVILSVMLVVLLIEAALLASRLFREETGGQTWAGLVLLPESLRSIAYGKLWGGALALVPAAGYLCVGGLLAPMLVADFFEGVVFDEDGFFVMVYLLTQVGLFLHLVALCSVSIRWAAWPVSVFFAGFVVVMWNVMFVSCLEGAFRGPGEEVVLFFMSGLGMVQVGAAHWMVGRRLATLAGE